HAPQEHVGRRLEVENQIRRRDVAREQLVEALVDEQLVVVEIQEREDLVLVEDVVANRRLREEVRLAQRRELPVSVEQIEELGLKGGTGAVRVEVGEKGILRLLEDRGGVEPRREPLCQRGFSRADRTFDGDVAEVQAAAMISS